MAVTPSARGRAKPINAAEETFRRWKPDNEIKCTLFFLTIYSLESRSFRQSVLIIAAIPCKRRRVGRIQTPNLNRLDKMASNRHFMHIYAISRIFRSCPRLHRAHYVHARPSSGRLLRCRRRPATTSTSPIAPPAIKSPASACPTWPPPSRTIRSSPATKPN